jgi:positive regulator of sigma E activity
MIEEEGIVAEIEGNIAKVAVMKKSACEQCAASGVCHPGDQEFMEAANPLGAAKGQKVKVVIAPQMYLILYGIPMVAFITRAIIAKNLPPLCRRGSMWAFIAETARLFRFYSFGPIKRSKRLKNINP